MLAHAVSTTTVLLGVSLLTKLLLESHAPAGGHAHELLRQAIHWRDVSVQDGAAAMALQHAAMASAFLQAARAVAARDADLERVSGVDLARLARSLDAQIAASRQSLPSADGGVVAPAA